MDSVTILNSFRDYTTNKLKCTFPRNYSLSGCEINQHDSCIADQKESTNQVSLLKIDRETLKKKSQ